MTLEDLIERVIETGIEAAKRDYSKRTDAIGVGKLEGALAGFEACRGRSLAEMRARLLQEEGRSAALRHEEPFDEVAYWHGRCLIAEIEWVLNCASAFQAMNGQEPAGGYTARGFMNVADILRADVLRTNIIRAVE